MRFSTTLITTLPLLALLATLTSGAWVITSNNTNCKNNCTCITVPGQLTPRVGGPNCPNSCTTIFSTYCTQSPPPSPTLGATHSKPPGGGSGGRTVARGAGGGSSKGKSAKAQSRKARRHFKDLEVEVDLEGGEEGYNYY